VAEGMQGMPVTIRTFDLGADKHKEDLDGLTRVAPNPALGLRAVRFNLRNKQVMRTQVRAILRAATSGNLSLVIPMVADVADVRMSRQVIAEEVERLASENATFAEVQVGAMIEVPSAVLTAEKIAREVDFFELGTNDLVQYTLAVDRGNDQVAEWFRTLHPAVLYGISRTLQAAKDAQIPLIVCGEMASTPAYAVLLGGLGTTDLSMTPAMIPRVRAVLSQVTIAEARDVALSCLAVATADEVEEIVRIEFKARWPELFPPSSLPK